MFSLVGKYAADSAAAQDYIIGMIGYAIPVILLGGILQSFVYERVFGTISFIYSSPGSRVAVFFRRGVFYLPNSILACSLSFVFGWLVLSLDLSTLNWWTTIVSVLLTAAACTAFALFLGNSTMMLGELFNLYNAAMGLFLAMTGVIIPIASLPWFLGEIANGIPLTHGLVALRDSFAGMDIRSVGEDLLLEAVVGLCYAIAGVVVYILVERDARARASLERSAA
jgi:ABC-2 type transport system permease protein